MLLNPAAARSGLDALAATDFYRDAHRRVFASMARLAEQGIAIDLIPLKSDLGGRGELDDVGGPSYISALVDGVPHSSNVEHYANIVREKRRLRDLVSFANKVASVAYDQGTPSKALLTDADAWLARLAGETDVEELVSQADALPAFTAALEHRVKHRHELLGLSTGFKTLDEMTCGWVPGEMTIVAGVPSTGKTALTLQSALHAARAGVSTHAAVVVISLEMDRLSLMYREAAHLANVELFKIRKGWFFSDRELNRVCTSMAETAQWPLYTCDISSVTIRELRTVCRRLRAQMPIGLLVVDYLQLMQGDGEDNRSMELGNIARQIKQLGRQIGAATVVLAQLSREHQKKKRKPEMHDIRESGAIEQHADNILMLYRDEDEKDAPTELLIRKQRNGPLGSVEFSFDKPTQTFVDTEAIKEAAKEPAQADLPAFTS